jgi:membrane protein YdbS with pleckstrin-like domain
MEMTPLHPGQLKVLRLRAAIAAAALLAAMLVADLTVLRKTMLPLGVATAVAAIMLLAWVILMPRRHYWGWGYASTEDELHIQHGLWTQTRTVVPFGRVQHIDVAQGPIERAFGVGRLILHTAGTRSSAVDLPGLEFGEAGIMRDAIRSKIRQDLM